MTAPKLTTWNNQCHHVRNPETLYPHPQPTDDDALQRIFRCFSPVKAAKREILLDRNQTCRHYYFINSGEMRIFTTDQEGNESSRFFAFEGNFITALPSFSAQDEFQLRK